MANLLVGVHLGKVLGQIHHWSLELMAVFLSHSGVGDPEQGYWTLGELRETQVRE